MKTTETKTTKVPVFRMIATMRKLKRILSGAAETLRDEREPSRGGGENCSVFYQVATTGIYRKWRALTTTDTEK